MTQLKLPIYDLIHVEETQAVKQALQHESMLDFDPDAMDAFGEIDGEVATVRREMGVAMAPQVVDYVKMLFLGGEEKLVVFAWHKEVLDILQHGLQEYGVVRVDGSTSGAQKDARIKKFVEDRHCRLILGNVLSLGTGTDGLQHVCTHALLAEPSWVNGENVQCFDRLDRGGQKGVVQGDIFVAPGSISERILATALRKLASTHAALDRRI